jgi:hypothetical protein
MKEDLTQLDLSAIFDLLAEYTAKYTRMMNEGAPDIEFENSEEIIISLQNEIARRRSMTAGESR